MKRLPCPRRSKKRCSTVTCKTTSCSRSCDASRASNRRWCGKAMQLALAQVGAHRQKGRRSLYTLHGDEPLLMQEAADAIRACARAQGYTERTVHTAQGAHFDWSEVLAAGGSLSLFADKQIVEIRIPSGKPGKDGSVALQQVAETARGNDSTLTMVMLPRLDKATKTGAWFAALEGNGTSIQIDPIERGQLPQWIVQR